MSDDIKSVRKMGSCGDSLYDGWGADDTRSEQVEALDRLWRKARGQTFTRDYREEDADRDAVRAALEAKPAAEPCPACGGSGDSGYRGGGGVLETARRKCPLCNGTGIIRGNWCDGEPDAPCVCIKPAAEVTDEAVDGEWQVAEYDGEYALVAEDSGRSLTVGDSYLNAQAIADLLNATIEARLSEKREVTDEGLREALRRVRSVIGGKEDYYALDCLATIEARLSEIERLREDYRELRDAATALTDSIGGLCEDAPTIEVCMDDQHNCSRFDRRRCELATKIRAIIEKGADRG